jgi:hypothetical protein
MLDSTGGNYHDILTRVCHDIVFLLNNDVPQISEQAVYKCQELLRNYRNLHLVCLRFHIIPDQRGHIHGDPRKFNRPRRDASYFIYRHIRQSLKRPPLHQSNFTSLYSKSLRTVWNNPGFREISEYLFDKPLDESLMISLCIMAPRLWPECIRQHVPWATRTPGHINRDRDHTVNLEFKMGRYSFDPEFCPWGPEVCVFSADSYHLTDYMFTDFFDDNIEFTSEKLKETHPVGPCWVWCVCLRTRRLDKFPPSRVSHFYVVDYENGIVLGGNTNTWIPTLLPSDIQVFFS